MKNRNNIALIVILGIFWSSFAAFTKTIAELSPIFITFSRMSVGLLSLIVVNLIIKQKCQWQVIATNNLQLFAVGMLNCIIPYCLFALAAKKLNSGVLAILDGTIPFFEIIIAVLFLKSKATKSSLTGLALGILGTILIAFESVIANDFNYEMLIAIAMVLLATFSYAIGAIFINYHCNHIKANEMTIGSKLITTPLLLPSAIIFDYNLLGAKELIAICGLGIICTGIANLLYFKIIAEEGARIGTSTVLLIPVFGVLIGYLFMNEKIDLLQIIGGIFILFSMKYILLQKK